MNNDFQSSSRSGYRSKRKKTNLILNSLIVIVVVLIVFVAYSIFSSGSDKSSAQKDVHNTTVKATSQQKETKQNSQETDTSASTSGSTDSTSGSTNSTATTDQQSSDTSSGSTDSQAVAGDGTSDNNGEKTTVNPNWKPVGTTQSGSHTAVYDSSSTDWKEMLTAISSATGLDQSNMIVWHLGRDRSTENGSVGTVSSKDKQQKYKVYIHWVDGQGWKPTKVEQITDIQNGN